VFVQKYHARDDCFLRLEKSLFLQNYNNKSKILKQKYKPDKTKRKNE